MPSSALPASARTRVLLAIALAGALAVVVALTATNAATPGSSAFSSITWRTAASQPFANSEAQGEVVGNKLYVFGGFDSAKACCTPTNRAYSYDPATDTWTPLANMPGQRPDGASTAAAFPGGVTHAGFASDSRYVYWAGGYIANAAGTGQTFGTNEVWRYDTQTNTYSKLANLPKRTSAVQAEVVGTTLHVFGGTTADSRASDFNDHFTLNLGTTGATWQTRNDTSKLAARHHMGSAVVGTKIYAIGGQTGHDEALATRADMQVFDTANAAAGWQSAAPLPRARGHISNSTYVYGGRIFVAGGETAHGAHIADVSVYDPAANSWADSTPLPANRVSGVAGAIGGRFFFTTGGGSAATYVGAPQNVPGACSPVSELACSSIRKGLPAALDFTGNEGGLYDAQGQDLGFTMVQPSTTGAYRPERLDVDGGTLKLRTTSGIAYRSPTTQGTNSNSLDNGLGVGVDATKPLRVETTIVRPALGTGSAEQSAVWFGIDQDNHVKVDLSSTNAAAPYHRPQVVWEVNGTPTEINLDSNLARNHSNQTVKLILETDPATRTVTGALSVDGGGREVIGTTAALPASWFTDTAAPQGASAGIFATHRNRAAAQGALTYTFSDFQVTDLTPNNEAPNMAVADSRLVVSDPVTPTGGYTKAVTVQNTGQGTLTLQAPTISDDPADDGADAGDWSAANAATNIPPNSSGTVNVTFNPTAVGVKGAYLTIRSNDPDQPNAQVKLRGLAHPAFTGSNEPPLQRILDAYEIPVSVGDTNPDSNGFDGPTPPVATATEVAAQQFERVGTGDVSVEPLAIYGPDSHNPLFTFGYHPAGQTTPRTEVMSVPYDTGSNRESQRLDVPGGIRTFNPGAAPFSTYSMWPAFNNRLVWQEDALNTWDGNNKHKVRVYPFRTPAGVDVPNAYLVAIEETTGAGDYQDFVFVIRNVRPVTRVASGEISSTTQDVVPYDDRLVMNRIQNPETGTRCRDAAATPPCSGGAAFPVNGVHDQATVRLRNTHATQPLTISGLQLSDTAAWQLVNPPSFPRELAPNATVDVTVRFVAQTPSGNPINRQFNGILNVLTSDADEAAFPVELSGMWQRQSENNTEPNNAQIATSYGFGTTILRSGQSLNNSGQLVKIGDEVHSQHWRRADTSQPVVVRQLAAFHTQGNTASFGINRMGSTSRATKLTHAGVDGQSYFPRLNGSSTALATASFTPTAGETGTVNGADANDGIFAMEIDGERTDWTLNNQAADVDCQAKKQTDPTVVCGHHVRTWPVEDRTGKLVPNKWFVGMDYSGINYDFNDNVYLVENVRPRFDADDPAVPKPCTPIACDKIAVASPFNLDFSSTKADSYTDKDDQGTGFTHVAEKAAGPGYVKPNLDLDTAAGQLKVTTTNGLSVTTTNTQDNLLGAGIKWSAITKRQMITTRVLNLPSPSGGFEQAGLWFGLGQDDLVKLHVWSDGSGVYKVETVAEVNGAIQTPVNGTTAAGVRTAALDAVGKDIDLKLVADPATRRVTAYYDLAGAGEQALATWLVPASFFAADPTAYDERVGTSSFAGIAASHRNGPAPLTYAFDRFAIADDTTAQRPRVTGVRPNPGETGVPLDTSISTDLELPNSGVDADSIHVDVDSVRLTNVATGQRVTGATGTSGGFDTISFAPTAKLAPNTQYRFEITNAAKDQSGVPFEPYTSTFTTGSGSTSATDAAFDKIAQPTAVAPEYLGFTSVAVGPDRKLYGLRNDGLIQRWAINANGSLGAAQDITTLQSGGERLGIGLVFDPAATADNLVVWVTHSTLGFDNMPNWGGAITKLSGANLQNRQDVVVNLPRSAKDHVTNGLSFGPDGKLYFPQGSLSAMGRMDGTWRNREETLLSGAVLALDPAKLPASLPLDVKTEEGGTYNPYASGAPLTIYATGVRNAYDALWHSNGSLYTPTNGSAAGGNTPAEPTPLPSSCANRIDGKAYTGAAGTKPVALTNVQQTQQDWLFRIVPGGYYGHPNPKRCEWVLNGGNPTSSNDDKGQVNAYPVGTQPDPNWRRDQAFSLGLNKSPNGVMEYKSNLFGGSLKGKVLVTHYSNDDDVFAYTPGPNGDIVPGSGQVVKGVENFIDPLDVVEDPATGNLYVSQYDQLGADVPKIFLMRARTTDQPSTDCQPLSPLACSQVKVTTDPAYEPKTGGIVDKDGQGTGFTMVQPNGAGADQSGLNAADLDQTTDRLTITARNGIQYKTDDGAGQPENALQNALGVGVEGGKKLRLETTVVNPPLFATGNSEQGGLWLGPDQDNYVKVVVAAAGTNPSYHRVQLVREQGGQAATADEINVPAAAPTAANRTDWSGQRVRLILEVDPATKVAEAWYQLGTGTVQRIGQLTVSDAILDGSRVSATQKAFGIGNYGGVFASKRNNTSGTAVQFAFEDTQIGEADVPNRAPQIAAIADLTTEQGVPASLQVQATDPDNDTPLSFDAVGLPDGVEIDPVSGRIAGTPTRSSQEAAEVTVTVRDPDGLEATETFTWTVTAAFKPVVEQLKVNFTSKSGTIISGYRNDAGQPFGDKATDVRYGWVGVNDAGTEVTHLPVDLSVGGTTNAGNGRERNVVTTDERLDSLMHMQGDDVHAFEQAKATPGSFNGTPKEGAWELALADGKYDVTVAAGDPSATTATSAPEQHFVRVEGQPAWATPYTPPSAAGLGRTRTATLEDVTVTDGRLTIDAIGGVNTKLMYVDVTRVANTAPTLAPVADQSDRDGDAVDVQLSGDDADGDDLTYTATGLPAGLSVDAATGKITGTIGANASASSPYSVTAKVDDGAANATRSFTWTVSESDAPRVDETAPADGATEVALDTDVTAEFSEGVSLDAADFVLKSGDTTIETAFSYDAASNTAKLDPAQPLARNTTYTATVKGGADGVVDGNGNRMAADETWSFTTVSTCGIYSELPCAQVDRPLDVDLDFAGEREGSLPKTGGFTMSQPQGQQLAAQPNLVSSYKPDLLALSGGQLKVSSTIGIQFRSKDTGGSADYNLLDNGLGIGFTQPNRLMRFETTVVPPGNANGTTASEQAGIWFGPDQDNYVKVIVTGNGNANARQWRVQLAREVNGTAAGTSLSTDQIDKNTGVTTATPFRLRLDVDPRGAGTVAAWYSTNAGSTWTRVDDTARNTLALAPSIAGGTSLPAALKDAGTTQTAGLMATKRGRSTTDAFVWSFDDWSAKVPNTAPVITGAANQSDDAGTKVELTTLRASDAENDPITWSATGLPGTLAIDPATGVVKGQLPAQPGTAEVTVKAESTGGLSDTETFTWAYPAAPAPAELPAGGFNVDFTAPAATADTGYAKDFGQAFGTKDTRRFGWVRVGSSTPLDLSVGGTTNAGNGRDRTACTTLSQKARSLMHMQGDDLPANFNGTRIEGAWEIAVPDGRYKVKVGVGDPTAGQDPEIDVVNAEGVKVVGPNQVQTAIATCRAENQAEGEQTVRVTDGRLTLDAIGGTNTKITYVDITPVVNRAPELPDLGDRTTAQGAEVTLDAGTTDPDGDTLEFSATGLPAGLSIDGDDGRISGTATAAPGVYDVTVTVIDRNGGVDTATFKWTIADATAPTVTSVTPAEGATGVAPDTLPKAQFSEAIKAGTGTFRVFRGTDEVAGTTSLSEDRRTATFTPATTLAYATAYRAVVEGATDDAGNAIATKEWTFTTTNRSPQLGNPGAQTAREGSAFALDLDAVEQDAGQSVTYAATGLPSGLEISPTTGLISGTPASGTARQTPYSVTVTASDSFTPAGTDSETFALTVAEGTVPTVDAVTPAGGALDVPVAANATATFSEPVKAGSVTFTLKQGDTTVPGTVTLSGDRRTATFDPTGSLDNAKTYSAAVTAAEDDAGNGLAAERTWQFTTLNRTPAVTAPASTSIKLGESVDLDADATDPDGHGVTFSATGLPAGVQIDDQTGAITGQPSAAGTSQVTVRATDDFAAAPKTGSATFTLTVLEATPPVTTITGGPADGSTTTSTSASFTFTSNEAGTFRCSVDGGEAQTCTSPRTLSGLAVGEHTFSVRAIDEAGNQGNVVTRTWTVNAPAGTVTDELPAGGTIETSGDAPSSADPVIAAVTTPNAGTVTIDEKATTTSTPTGYALLGRQFDITAPEGSAAQPLRLEFRLDSTVLDGATAQDLVVLRNGEPVPACTGTSGSTAPDPCVVERQALAGGDVRIVVLTSRASAWNFGKAVSQRQPVRVNTGGPAQTVGSVTWEACTSATACGGGTMTGGRIYDNNFTVANPIAPANARIYREEWTGGTQTGVAVGQQAFAWSRPLANGAYRLRLHFNEHNQRAANLRLFDINVEGGTPEVSNFDVFSAAGGADRPYVREIPVTLTDGTLNVAFITRKENALLNAIEVIPTEPDTTAPTATITGGPAAGSSTQSTTAQFTFTSSEQGSTFRCRLDGGAEQTCTSPRSLTGLGVGQHQFQVVAVDAAGNRSEPVTRSWTVTPPERPTVRVNMGGPAQTVGSASWTACTTAASCGGGTMTGGFVYDNNVTVGSPVSPANARVYREEWTGGQTNGIPAGGTAFTWNRALPNGEYRVRLHFNEHNQKAVGARVFDVDLEGGSDELPGLDVFREAGGVDKPIVKETTVTVTDGMLNVAFIRRVENAMVNGIEVLPVGIDNPTPPDTTKPVTTITGGPAAGSTTSNTNATFTFTANESATFTCAVDGGTPAVCTSPREISGLSVGQHTFTVRATDAAGNVGDPVTRTWNVGTQPDPRTPIRVDMAGPAQTVNGVSWAACMSAASCGGGTVTGGFQVDNNFTVSNPIAPANARIYREEWTGGQTNGVPVGGTAFTYNRPVTNGRWLVRLHLNEHNQRAAGRRVFDVNVEGGSTEVSNLDVFAAAGGADRPYVREITTDVADGTLNVAFIRRVENAMVNGIELIPVAAPAPAQTTTAAASVQRTAPPAVPLVPVAPKKGSVVASEDSLAPILPLRLDAGGQGASVGTSRFAGCVGKRCGGYITGGGAYLVGGAASAKARKAGGKAALHATVWAGAAATGKTPKLAFTVHAPVPQPGTYRVKLHFTEPAYAQKGKRLFDVNVEGGKAELTKFDVFKAARGRLKPITRTFTAKVVDGELTIQFLSRRDRALVSAVEVLPAGR